MDAFESLLELSLHLDSESESKSETDSDAPLVFDKEHIDKLLSGPRFSFGPNAMVEILFVAVDPGGGASGSDSAVVTFCYNEAGDPVVGWGIDAGRGGGAVYCA